MLFICNVLACASLIFAQNTVNDDYSNTCEFRSLALEEENRRLEHNLQGWCVISAKVRMSYDNPLTNTLFYD